MPERLFRHNEIHIHAEMRPIRTAAMNSFSFADFLKTPQGETLHAWESSQYDEFSADAFGREALQVGAPQLDTLRARVKATTNSTTGFFVPPCKPCRPKADGCPFPPNRLIW